MAGLQERVGWNQDPGLTLELLQQVPDGTILLDDLEEGGVQLLVQLRQLRGHPSAIHAHP
jgi:hypothetical protein